MGDVFQIKLIKPRKLSVDAVRLEVLNALRKEGRIEVRLLNGTIEHFEGAKPTFEFKIGLTRRVASVTTYPSGDPEGVEKWRRLNDGIPPDGKIIRPVTPGVKALRMPETYTRKTMPGVFKSRAGGPSGDVIFRKSARHLPRGIKAGRWLETLLVRRRKPFYYLMFEAMNRGLKKRVPM